MQRHYVRIISFCPKVPQHIFSDAKYIQLCGTRMEHHLHFFLHSPQDHYVMVRVWSSQQTYGWYYTETGDIAQKREGLLYLTQMFEMA